MKRVFQPFFFTFDGFVDFLAGFPDKEQATQKQNQITGGNFLTEYCKSGFVRRVTQAMDASSARRMTMAPANPRRRA